MLFEGSSTEHAYYKTEGTNLLFATPFASCGQAISIIQVVCLLLYICYWHICFISVRFNFNAKVSDTLHIVKHGIYWVRICYIYIGSEYTLYHMESKSLLHNKFPDLLSPNKWNQCMQSPSRGTENIGINWWLWGRMYMLVYVIFLLMPRVIFPGIPL